MCTPTRPTPTWPHLRTLGRRIMGTPRTTRPRPPSDPRVPDPHMPAAAARSPPSPTSRYALVTRRDRSRATFQKLSSHVPQACAPASSCTPPAYVLVTHPGGGDARAQGHVCSGYVTMGYVTLCMYMTLCMYVTLCRRSRQERVRPARSRIRNRIRSLPRMRVAA